MLYHYTDFAAFDGIIRSGELRLNNILNMNDAAEMRLFMNGICRAVEERLTYHHRQEMITHIKDFFEDEMAAEFHYSAYAACFSKYRDDASQWERYGHLGQGVCIAFHEELLHKLLGGAVSLQEVYYRSDMSEHPLVDDFCTLLESPASFTELLPQIRELMNKAWVQSAAFKHPSFSNEKESRMVVSPFISDEWAIEPQYHVSMNRIKKYYPLDLNRMCHKAGLEFSDLVGEIIIGPTSSQSLPILQDYLTDSGLGILKDKITMSACPLRQPTS